MDLPFTNIRQVLSLHNKVSPEKIFLTVISDGGREELSYAEFSARCHQTANFLQEDLGIKPGDKVGIIDDQPADTAVLVMACWLVGAIPTFLHGMTFEQVRQREDAKVCFIRDHDKPSHWASFSEVVKFHNPSDKELVLIQLGGKPTEGYLHFDSLVRGMPNSFFNDYAEPTLASPAFQAVNEYTDSFVTATQGELLIASQKLANSQAITGNQRIITCLPISAIYTDIVLDTVCVFMTALLVGSSLVIDTQFFDNVQPHLWRVVAAERLNIVYIHSTRLPQLITLAKEQKAAGKPIYGEGIYQQDIKQLRHIYCPSAGGQDDLINQFTTMFPFPVITDH